MSTSQFCTLATLFFMLMMKIGFFTEEGVSLELMNNILMFIMFFPLFVAIYIVGLALHEGLHVACKEVYIPKMKKAEKKVEQKLYDLGLRVDV